MEETCRLPSTLDYVYRPGIGNRRFAIVTFTGRGTNDVIDYRAPIWFAFDALAFANRVSLEPKQQIFFSNFNRCV